MNLTRTIISKENNKTKSEINRGNIKLLLFIVYLTSTCSLAQDINTNTGVYMYGRSPPPLITSSSLTPCIISFFDNLIEHYLTKYGIVWKEGKSSGGGEADTVKSTCTAAWQYGML